MRVRTLVAASFMLVNHATSTSADQIEAPPPRNEEERANISCNAPGTISLPLVPNEGTARAIYMAIARAVSPTKLQKSQVIAVSDEGDKWILSPTKKKAKTRYYRNAKGEEMESVTITHGGGNLEMEINKCNAATIAYFSR